MPEGSSEDEKFLEEVFGSIRTNNSTRLVKKATEAGSEEDSIPNPGVPKLTGDESDREFDTKLDTIEEQARWDRIPKADPAPCKACGQPTPYRCRRCMAPLCPLHFWWGRYPLCPRCGGKSIAITITCATLGALCALLTLWAIAGNLGR